MALEVVERVTERFFDAARPRGGLGLALPAQNVCSSRALYKLIVSKKKNRRYPFFTCCTQQR